MIITYSSGRNQKIHISTDGEYAFTVDADFWFSLGIYQNAEMDEDAFEELKEKVMVRRAFNKGIDLLSRRAHAKRELIEKLSKTNEKKYAIIATNALEARGYIDDKDFAAQYYEYLHSVKHFGKRRISLELAKKGIDKSLIDELQLADQSDAREEIRGIIERKYPSRFSDRKVYDRAFRYLQRAGYSYSDIKSVLQEYLSEEFDEWQA